MYWPSFNDIYFKIVPEKFLSLASLFESQVLGIYKLVEFDEIDKNKKFKFAAL